MLWKKSPNKKPEYRIENDELALPEIHTGKVGAATPPAQEKAERQTIQYDNVAVPEIHLPGRKPVR